MVCTETVSKQQYCQSGINAPLEVSNSATYSATPLKQIGATIHEWVMGKTGRGSGVSVSASVVKAGRLGTGRSLD